MLNSDLSKLLHTGAAIDPACRALTGGQPDHCRHGIEYATICHECDDERADDHANPLAVPEPQRGSAALAQGCGASPSRAATLGKPSPAPTNPGGVAPFRGAKIYLAARYSRADQLRDLCGQLARLGYIITSRWIYGGHELSKEASAEAAHAERARFAREDWDDMVSAHIVISITEEPRKTATRGGRHVEFGGALALGKRVVVIGHRENVFYCLPSVEFYASQWDLLRAWSPNP